MSVQVKHRRDTAANIAGFTPAQGEIVVDTTNNRLIVGDGTTVGGWAAAKLAETSAATRRAVSDANTAVTSSDRLIAYTALTAARTVTLCAASTFPAGTVLRVIDESGACSSANTISIARSGSDTICGGASFLLNGAYLSAALESDGVSKWTTVNNGVNEQVALIGVGTAPDPGNPLSVCGSTALFNGTNFSFTINKSVATNTASVLFQDGFSARAQIGLLGSDNFAFKVSANGSTFASGLVFDAATGAPSFGNARTPVADANYTGLATDREIAFTAITAARTLTLPSAASFPAGHPLVVVDESGAVSLTNTIAVTAAGSDTIGGRTSGKIVTAYGHLRLTSNGANAWTVVGRSINIVTYATVGTNSYAPTPGLVKADVHLYAGGGGAGGGALQAASTVAAGGGGGGGGGGVVGTFSAAQIGASQTITIGAGGAAGAAATASATAGGAGGVGGNTTFGSLLTAFGGGGGVGGQLGGASGGGQGGSAYSVGGSGSGASGGNSGTGLGTGGGGASGGQSGYPGVASGGGGGTSVGGAANGGAALLAASGGGSGGGLSAANAVSWGANGGACLSPSNAAVGGAGAGPGGASPSLASRALNQFFGAGGAGGGSSLTAASTGGAGGTPGGGGGGGGSAQNGGSAGAGGVGGAGYAIIVEYF